MEAKDPNQQSQQGTETTAVDTENTQQGIAVNDGAALLDEIAAVDATAVGGDDTASGNEEGAAAPSQEDGAESPSGDVSTATGDISTAIGDTTTLTGDVVITAPSVDVGGEVKETPATAVTGDEIAKEVATGDASGVVTEQPAAATPTIAQEPIVPVEPTPAAGSEEGISDNGGEAGNEGGEVDPFEELIKFQTFNQTEVLAARDFVTRVNRYIEKMHPDKYIDPKDAAFEQRALYNAYLVALTGSAKLARWAVPYLLDKFYTHRNDVFSAQRINHCLGQVNLTKDKLTLLTGLNNLFLSTCEPEGRKMNLKRVNLRQLTTQISSVWGHSRFGINLLEGYNLAGI